MTQYPNIPYPPLSNPVDPDAPSAPYSPVLYHVDADSRRFVSPLTWRPPLMAQALPTIHLSAITIIHIRPYSGGVPLTIDDEALALIKVADRNRNPLHLSYATPINNEYYEAIIDLIDHSDITAMGQGYIELMINNKVILSDKCVIGSALFPPNEQPPSPYGTIVNVTDGAITLSTTPSLYQLSPIPSDQTELNLTFISSGTDNIHKLLFHSEAPSLVINVDGASISGHYTGPGWYCAMMEESGSIIAINLERLTDFTTESVYTVKGFNPILVEDEWPTYGRRDSFYIHTTTREARIWTGGEWYPVGSSEYKYAPKSETDPLPMGLVAAKGVEEKYAAGDHVHPATGLVKSTEKGAANGVAELDADGKVPASMLPTIPAPGPALSNTAPVALAATAAAGSSTDAARADHAHPTTGLVLASEKGAANGVAELGADGKVPAEQLPTIPDAGPALSNTAPVALAAAADPGESADAARADHVHPTTGLATLVDGKVPSAQLPTVITAAEARKIAKKQSLIFG